MNAIEENVITFTRREEQILILLARYNTHEEICSILNLKVGTLDQHIANIRRKTNKIGIKLVKYAIEQGFGREEVSA